MDHRARERLVTTEVPFQPRRVELAQHLHAQRTGRRHAEPVAERAEAIEQPVAEDEGAVHRAQRGARGIGGVHGSRSLRQARGRQCPPLQ